MTDENAASKPKKIDKAEIEGLPDKAMVQRIGKTVYVYYAYNYRLNGKGYQDRDYLGVVEDNKFVPNDYYLLRKPARLPRPVENWSKPEKRQIEQEKLLKLQPQSKPPVDEKEPFDKCAGTTALAAAMLYESNLVEDIASCVEDPKLLQDALNVAMHAAVTKDATYLAESENEVQKFIGQGCPTSQRASETHAALGAITDLPMRLGKLRCSRLSKGDLLALDGTRIDCRSENISVSATGKRKEGDYGQQINLSTLFNATTGQAVAYRAFAGNFNDIKTLSDFRSLWKSYDLKSTEPTIVADRGYYSADEVVRLSKDGIHFIVGVTTCLKCVQAVIDKRNHEFFSFRNHLERRGCFGLSAPVVITSKSGSANVNLYIFRDPLQGMRAADELRAKLRKFADKWEKGKLSAKFMAECFKLQDNLIPPEPDEIWDDKSLKSNLLFFFKRPWNEGQSLEINEATFERYCYTLGYFAIVSDLKVSCRKILDDYALRNEVEIFFRKHKEIFRTTRVHNDATLNGRMLTTFLATSIKTELLHRIRNGVKAETDEEETDEKETKGLDYSVNEVLLKLRKVHLVRYEDGHLELTNVTSKEKELVASLGFPGLFDSAEKVNELLSTGRLNQAFAKAASSLQK